MHSILGHRMSEWTGRLPTLEEELALANLALDLIGQARALYSMRASSPIIPRTSFAYRRDDRLAATV